ncbi:hypothetical protein ACLVWU_10050 [Bdellovibrio sp. HCB290]|uniref:hypothetical protein n=1 Tax=Bdellovibrio sp. HCB290 TaxID=3394356 RepID=UPI0039B57513
MGLIKETFEDYKYAADDEPMEARPEEFMDYLPSFPLEAMAGSLVISSEGVVLQFKSNTRFERRSEDSHSFTL